MSSCHAWNKLSRLATAEDWEKHMHNLTQLQLRADLAHSRVNSCPDSPTFKVFHAGPGLVLESVSSKDREVESYVTVIRCRLSAV